MPTKAYKNIEDLYNDEYLEDGGETAFCSLAALVPSNISNDEYGSVCYNTVLAISTLIEKCPKMTSNHKRTMLSRMSLGIGITGLAESLYKEGLDYDGSDKSLEFVHDLAERHYYYLLKASIDMATLFGRSADGITDWLPIDTKVSKWENKMPWEELRGKPRLNSVLAAMMPCESSSLASGTTNSVYPPREKIVNKKSRKGVVQFICNPFKEGVHLTAWEVPSITLSKYYSVVQDFTDQGISADNYFDPTQYEGGRKPLSDLIREWVAHFRLGNKSMYYVNTRDKTSGSVHDVLRSEYVEEACDSCTL